MSLPLGTDELLVAYLDNELSKTQRDELENRLREDDVLANRLALLERSNLPFKAAFEPLLAQAPVARLEHQLSPETGKQPGVSRRVLIAAAASFLAIGVIGDRAVLHFTQPKDNWRELVAQYMALYTPETLADTPTVEALDNQLRVTQEQLGISLSRAGLTLPNAALKNARVLAYDEQQIAQITWLDATHGPLALCITRNAGAVLPTQSEQRLGMNIVYWTSVGHQFMVIGHNSAAQISEIATRLQKNVGT